MKQPSGKKRYTLTALMPGGIIVAAAKGERNEIMNENKLIGIVLAGGYSKRMGSDKGLIKSGHLTWSEIAFHNLYSLDLPVYLSLRAEQIEGYSEIFGSKYFIKDKELVKGPLNGLLSAHYEYPDCDIFLLACDLPDLTQSTIVNLYQVYKDHIEEHDFFVYKHGEYTEPLCGIYKASGLEKIMGLVDEGQLSGYSMKHILEICTTMKVPIQDHKLSEFKNYNFADN